MVHGYAYMMKEKKKQNAPNVENLKKHTIEEMLLLKKFLSVAKNATKYNMKTLQTEFLLKDKEVSEHHYMEMLASLPPRMQATNAFLVGEAYDTGLDMSGRNAPRYEMYFVEDECHYYGGLVSVSDFDTFLITEDQAIMRDFIRNR